MSVCNCSICTKKGFLHLIVAADDLELTTSKDTLTTYQFNTGVAKHHFCNVCGISAFYVPRSHPTGFSVNAHCLTGAGLHWFDLEHFDGQNWEAHVQKIR